MQQRAKDRHRKMGLKGDIEALAGARRALKKQKLDHSKGQLNLEWIYDVIVSSKRPTKIFKDFCPGCLLEGRTEILEIFGWHFGRSDSEFLWQKAKNLHSKTFAIVNKSHAKRNYWVCLAYSKMATWKSCSFRQQLMAILH